MNALIIGCGYGGSRYLEALLFMENFEITLCGFEISGKTKLRAHENNLDYIIYQNNINFNSFDLIIVSTPELSRDYIIKDISNQSYSGALIIDKPFAIGEKQCNLFFSLLDEINFFVPYSRRFIQNKPIILRKENVIYVPTKGLDSTKNDMIALTPHIIDIIFYSLGKKELKCLEISDNILTFIYDDSKFKIHFDKHNNGQGIIFNEKLEKWPNYLIANFRAIIYIINNKVNKKDIYDQNLTISIFMETLFKRLNIL